MCHTRILPNSDSAINSSPDEIGGHFSASSVHGDGHTRGDTAAGGGRLGNKGDLSYPDASAREKPGHTGRYRAQLAMREILSKDHAIHTCGWRLGAAAGIRSDGRGKTRVEGVASCGNGHVCPVCGGKIAAARADEIRAAVAEASARGLQTVLVTLTIQHRTSDKLADLLADLMGAWSYAYANAGAARVRFNERFNVAGFIRGLEVRYSRRAGWHPHYHLLVFVDAGAGVDDIETELHDRIFQRYAHFLTSDDERIVCKRRNRRGYHANDKTIDVRAAAGVDEYLTKIAAEVSIGQDKIGRDDASYSPFQLATLYDKTRADWVPGVLREYADAMRGRAALRWSRGLRDLLELGAELTDEDIADMEDLPDDEGNTPEVEALPDPWVFWDDGPVYTSLWRRGLVGEARDISGHVNGWDSDEVRQFYQWVATVTGMPDVDIDDAVMRVWWINEKLLAGGEMTLDASAELAAADREKWRSAWRSAQNLYRASKELEAANVRPELWPDKLFAAGFTVDEIEPFMRRFWSGLPLSPEVGDHAVFVLPEVQS